MLYLYLDASNGAVLNTFVKTNCCPKIFIEDGIVLSNSGERIYTVHNRPSWRTVTMNRLEYNTGTTSFDKYTARSWSRHVDTS